MARGRAPRPSGATSCCARSPADRRPHAPGHCRKRRRPAHPAIDPRPPKIRRPRIGMLRSRMRADRNRIARPPDQNASAADAGSRPRHPRGSKLAVRGCPAQPRGLQAETAVQRLLAQRALDQLLLEGSSCRDKSGCRCSTETAIVLATAHRPYRCGAGCARSQVPK